MPDDTVISFYAVSKFRIKLSDYQKVAADNIVWHSRTCVRQQKISNTYKIKVETRNSEKLTLI